jgi:lipopolysaccharide/colanic/teichoic acid biosynthesis glycosyltransferase
MDASVAIDANQSVRQSRAYEMISRSLDVSVSFLLLVLTFPVFILVALWVWLDSPGPVIFRQIRVGKGGRPFSFYKFRTMHVDARQLFPHLYRYDYTPEEFRTFRFKMVEDPRLTRFGKYLRRTTLDELPNLYNVLKGDMALVGPRPEIPEMAQLYQPYQLKKFSVKPGVTGLAQVNGRGLLTIQETLRYDLEYVDTQCLKNDMAILMKTVKVTVLRIGAF